VNDNWLEISDENINVEEIMQQIRERIARRSGVPLPEGVERPEDVAESLWREMVGDVGEEATVFYGRVPIRQRDCDIVPRHYVIDWRIPILGPIHSVVRRVINAEIRRYLFSSLEKQSSYNRKVAQVLRDLVRENVRLRQEIEELRAELE
jgi:hypothetical protein